MKLARVETGSAVVASVEVDGRWVPIADVLHGVQDTGDTVESLSRLDELGRRVGTVVPSSSCPRVGEVVLRAPLERPGKIIGIGLNYRDHARELGTEPPETPLVFAKWVTSLQGPTGALHWRPDLTSQLDYEVELAVVIGATVRDVSVHDALAVVGGYAVANDVSARDVQSNEGQWVRSKSFDGACPLGPWITTVDEVADPQGLFLRTLVNGEVRQDSSTREMVFGVASLISHVSRGTTLEPGDVILTGTPAGVAAGRGGPWLSVGDVVRCEIDGLGALEHVVGGGG